MKTITSVLIGLAIAFQARAQSVMTSPIGGEELSAGAVRTISWDTKLVKGLVSLSLWDGGKGKWSTIWNNVPAEEGKVTWGVPANLDGKRFRIKLSADSVYGSNMTRTFFSIVQPQVASVKPTVLHSSLPEIRVHPNPITSHALICLDEIPAGEKFFAEVIDAKGGHVATIYDAVPEADLGICYRLDCSQLAAGTYLVRVASGSTGKTMKFVKE